MTLSGLLLVAVYPVWIAFSGIVTELLLRGSFGMTNLAVIDWVSPAALSILTATVVDISVLSLAFRQKVGKRLLFAILTADALCILVAGYMMVSYGAVHPAVA